MQEIIVVGAGLGGLTFANALQKANASLRVTVLERDRDISAHPQGYGITLNKDGGLWALKHLGLYMGRSPQPAGPWGYGS
jgi:2-polyprenyl-6-methoxyphenol hydroxylase-like FAD-dependent oxidoreductase